MARQGRRKARVAAPPFWGANEFLDMARSTECLYSVFAVTYRPVVPANRSILLAVFILAEPTGRLLLSRTLANWKSVLAVQPDADIDLLRHIVAELESEMRGDSLSLDRSLDWGNLIGITKSTFLSIETPSTLVERFFHTDQIKNRLADDHEI